MRCWLAVAGTMAAPSARPGSAQMQQSAGGATGPQVIVLPTIDDIHLPRRYQRRPIDQKEIEYINVSFNGFPIGIFTWRCFWKLSFTLVYSNMIFIMYIKKFFLYSIIIVLYIFYILRSISFIHMLICVFQRGGPE